MSLMKRFALIFRSKANRALDRAEDPGQMLDYSFERQREMLTKMRRGLVEVSAARKRIEMEAQKIQNDADRLSDQAKKAIDLGREDLAREALTRKAALNGQLTGLRNQHSELSEQEEKLTRAIQQATAKVEAFRTRKETVKATYTAAQAQVRINEAFSGISTEMGDVSQAIQRAEDKTQQMQARAGAVDELIASGALDDSSGQSDALTRELDALSASSNIEAELAAMKGLPAPERRELG